MPAILLTHVLSTVETPLTATSLQWPFFRADKSYTDSCLNLSTMATSLQRWLSSVPMVAIMNRFNSYFWQGIYLPFSKCKLTCTLFDCWKLALFICFYVFLPFKNCSSNKMSQLTKENKTVKVTNYRDLPKQRILVQVSDAEEKELRTHNSEEELK